MGYPFLLKSLQRLILLIGLCQAYTSESNQEKAVRDLLIRLIPDVYSSFEITVDPTIFNDDQISFKILKTSENSTVKITGNSGVAAAWGVHHYLRNFCNCHISWDGDQLKLPEILPNASVELRSADRYRYYQNVCTFGYSSAWWNWSRWEREIDWMALQGINLPLAFIGQEAIFKRVFNNLGLSDAELEEFFVGPAFLPWGRMGNIRGWGGPLSDSWHIRTVKLQHKILNRMRSFGMKPVLPAFAGFVPRNISRIYPDHEVAKAERWNNFDDKYCCPSLLHPEDPLFAQIGERFISEMTKEWGTDHFYNCDMFNEIRPVNDTPEYIRSVGQSVFTGMKLADSKAIWVMQGWLFTDRGFWTEERAKALLTSVPSGKMIVLDLNSDGSPFYKKFDSYYGQPFIWNTLHNFGGTSGMYGYLDSIGMGIIEARSYKNSTLVGTGLTMEGINQNYIVYDFTLDMGVRDSVTDVNHWVKNYATQRYGEYNEFTDRAWLLLKRSLYTGLAGRDATLIRRPSMDAFSPIFYNVEDVILAWDNLYEVSNKFKGIKPFMHDLVDVSRQVLQDMFSLQYLFVVHSYKQRKMHDLRTSSKTLLKILYDMDTILNTNQQFMLGPWIESAKAAAPLEEKSQFEYNARNQITLWGPRGEIVDYAAKQWGGLVMDYYIPRWTLFVDTLRECLINNSTFDKDKFRQKVFTNVEQPFTFSKKIYPVEPIGSTLHALEQIYETWRPFYTSNVAIYRKLTKKLKEKRMQRKKKNGKRNQL
ncbi:alpha-N-acetylglucosaminidase-like isoform X2 [Artemia franciscana]|uniref:alpha-N-acetylglucosaminidase-like isoform X2 n=1 Tax=Artemia franciscana TaxID=6661 RepID=UPI0032DB0B09